MRPLLLVLIAVLAGACANGPSPEEVATAVMAAREAVASPASALGTTAEAVVVAVTDVRLNAAGTLIERQARLDAVSEGPVQDLADALGQADSVHLDSEIDEIRMAQAAWLTTRAAASDLLSAAGEQLDELQRILAWDERLGQLAATWQEPGSRRLQLERFAENADLADQLAADIRADAPTTCPEQLERRQEAAEFIAESTRELRGHIEAYRGTTFDERRLELADDPTGFGLPLHELDNQDVDCWRERSGIATAALLDALAGLQDALNPAGL